MSNLAPEFLSIMSSSAAFATSPAPDADSFGLRPLNAIAATSTGGVPQSRVHRILTDLEAPLTALHEQGRMHGALSPTTIGLDMNGKAHLMPTPSSPSAGAGSGPGPGMAAQQYPGHAENRQADGQGQGQVAGGDDLDLPQAGYAAFEQYADDELLPRGPWTDVYGLSAVACQLITGAPPPDAEARRDRDDYVPLAQRMPEGYDSAFLSAVDAGLAMAAARRPNSMAAYLALFGGMEPAPAMPALSEPEVVIVQDDYDEEEDDEPEPATRRRLSFWGVFIVLLAAVLAVPVWLWLGSGNGLHGSRTQGVDGSGGSSFTPLSQRDARPADAGRPAAEGGTGVAGGGAGASTAPPGGSAATAGAGSAAPSGYANGAQSGVQGGDSTASLGNGGPMGGSSGAPNGSSTAAPALSLNGTGNAARSTPGTATAEAGAGGSDTPARTPDAAGNRAGSGVAGVPQPYHSTVTLGGGAPADAGAQGSRTADGSGAEGAADAGQGAQARAGAAATDAAGKTARPAVTGAPVPVRIDVRPWGEIVIDGVARGVSPPLKELRLAPGKHSVIIKNTGLPSFRMTLEVKAGTPAVISHVFN
ncbi:hypothetical protein [Bordetella sp. LUAb4]|uniref:hypothetical protein n=1 Tax=Bordetella sp. LUAb4 TaxID=2843195 RepID=UPI001E47F267|nr:hypothetical protein [Bordetella sp. LUAb4]